MKMNIRKDGTHKGGRKGEGMIEQWPCGLKTEEEKVEEERGKEEVTGSRAALELGMIEVAVLRNTTVCYKLYPGLVYCSGLNSVLPKCVSTRNLNVTLSGNWVFADLTGSIKIRSYGIE